MSKTDKTRPIQVRLWDDLDKVPYHVCLGKDCDLPSSLEQDLAQPSEPGHCIWVFNYTGINVCSCNLCSGRDYRLLAKRSDRRKVRAFLTSKRNTVFEDVWEDFVLDSDQRRWKY